MSGFVRQRGGGGGDGGRDRKRERERRAVWKEGGRERGRWRGGDKMKFYICESNRYIARVRFLTSSPHPNESQL